MSDTPESTFIAEVAPLTSTRILHEASDNLTLWEQVQSHVILKQLGAAIEARLKTLRNPLMAIVQSKGEINDKGTKKYVVEGTSICLESRKANEPDPTLLTALLKEKSIDIHEAFDDVTVLQLNPSKLDYLVQTGKLKPQDVQALCKEIPALRIYPSKALKASVESLKLVGKTKEEEEASCLPPVAP